MNEIMSIENYTDTYGGRNYAEYPISINGEKLKENLNNSKLWGKGEVTDYIDKRNDNQCDIHRGSDFVYKNNGTTKFISVSMKKSRSGKTVNWEFRKNFSGKIEL